MSDEPEELKYSFQREGLRTVLVNDREEFQALYTRLGVPYSFREPNKDEREERVIAVMEIENGGDNPKIGGYLGFSTSIYFTTDGQFLRQSFWE